MAGNKIDIAVQALQRLLSAPVSDPTTAITVIDAIQPVRDLIARYGDRWIGLDDAARLLRVQSTEDVVYWAEQGLLKSQTTESGGLKVSLDDVLRQRVSTERLAAIDAGTPPIAHEELMTLLSPEGYRPRG